MSTNVKYINKASKDVIYFFIDDSGTILSDKKQKEVKKGFQDKKIYLPNDIKSFCVSAVGLTKTQIYKGKKLSKDLKTSFGIKHYYPFHRNKMKPGKLKNGFSHLSDENLFSITKNLNKFIKKYQISFATAGINNYAEIYHGNFYNKKDILMTLYKSLMNSINQIMINKFPDKKAIVVFEGENPRSDYSRLIFSNKANLENSLNKIRSIRFMKKSNKNNIPNFGIELIDYINGSMFSMFGLADFHIHFKNNMDINNLNKLKYFSYINK